MIHSNTSFIISNIISRTSNVFVFFSIEVGFTDDTDNIRTKFRVLDMKRTIVGFEQNLLY